MGVAQCVVGGACGARAPPHSLTVHGGGVAARRTIFALTLVKYRGASLTLLVRLITSSFIKGINNLVSLQPQIEKTLTSRSRAARPSHRHHNNTST